MTMKWAKIVDDEKKICEVSVGSDTNYYEENGYTRMDVVHGIDGRWYLRGYEVGEPTIPMKLERIEELKNLLAQYDYIGVKIATGCATIEDYKDIIAQCEEYRKEIRRLLKETNANS